MIQTQILKMFRRKNKTIKVKHSPILECHLHSLTFQRFQTFWNTIFRINKGKNMTICLDEPIKYTHKSPKTFIRSFCLHLTFQISFFTVASILLKSIILNYVDAILFCDFKKQFLYNFFLSKFNLLLCLIGSFHYIVKINDVFRDFCHVYNAY